MRRRRSAAPAATETGQAGSAIVEFIFVAVLIMVPLVYLAVAVAVVQRSRLATTTAARDVGRAIASSPSVAEADLRAQAALRIALRAQGMAATDADLRYVADDVGCQAAAITPSLALGSSFAVCVVRHQPLPAIPDTLSGRGIITIGRYVVHMDEFRAAA